MDAIAEYSDSDEGEAHRETRPGIQSFTVSSSARGTEDTSKIALVSLLPSNIQEALRGNVSYDSDSEEETGGGEPLNAEGTDIGYRSHLLSILPAPKNKLSVETKATSRQGCDRWELEDLLVIEMGDAK